MTHDLQPGAAGSAAPAASAAPVAPAALVAPAAPVAESPGTVHRLDVVSDTICPWCYVGKRRLAAALPVLAAEGLRFEVTWRPFQLNPAMPTEGLDRRLYRSAKFGSWEKSQALDAQVAAAGRGDGLVFRHDLMAKTPNTLASHALIRLGLELGGPALQDRVVEALFAAYFAQGRDVGDREVLAELGEGVGIDRARSLAFLADPASAAAVADEERLARGLGLNGVPSYVLDGRYLFSGAQPARAMVRALREASAVPATPGRAAASAATAAAAGGPRAPA
jgi:predicted DsbA family dithiol-disulfide isomerase